MPHSAEASAEILPHARTAAHPLPHRQEAFARHVAAGRSLTDAARLAGYAWDSARQTGSRLMKEQRIAARVADLAHASDNQRQGELDELVSALKRLMIDTMARENDFAALRAIDMIARLRGLVPTTAKRSDGLETALEEMRRQQPETDEAEVEDEVGAGEKAETEVEDADPTSFEAPEENTMFDPPMPPELRLAVEPAPAHTPNPPAQSRHSAIEAARAAVRRRLFCYEHLMARHPELSGKIRDLSDALAYFGEDDNLLPPELWPNSTHPGHHTGQHPDHQAGNSPE
jgi:phage terminase small subunit